MRHNNGLIISLLFISLLFSTTSGVDKHESQFLNYKTMFTTLDRVVFDIIRDECERQKFHLTVALAFADAESSFNPDAVSSAGARGLFQVLPSTAREMGFKQDLEHPPTGIHAGVKYLDFLRGYFEPQIKPEERIWFALASYNAGMGHVSDARRLARRLGLNPDLWFDNVEKAMLLLSKPEYARQARHGYVRGAEPVNYVREIRDRHKSYLQVTGD